MTKNGKWGRTKGRTIDKCSKCGTTQVPHVGNELCKNCYSKIWRGGEKWSVWRKAYSKKKRMIILSHYSKGKLKCECCGENKYEFLSIDHINGGGTKERREKGPGLGLYAFIIKNNFPSGYRVLCHNCNQSLGLYGYCPHNKGI